MTKSEAIQTFLERLAIPVYATSAVPDTAEMPYLTWDGVFSAFGDGECAITANIWCYTESESVPDALCDTLSALIGRGGRVLVCDGGAVWLKRGSPFAQRVKNTGDDKVKRRYINLSAEFLTAD